MLALIKLLFLVSSVSLFVYRPVEKLHSAHLNLYIMGAATQKMFTLKNDSNNYCIIKLVAVD